MFIKLEVGLVQDMANLADTIQFKGKRKSYETSNRTELGMVGCALCKVEKLCTNMTSIWLTQNQGYCLRTIRLMRSGRAMHLWLPREAAKKLISRWKWMIDGQENSNALRWECQIRIHGEGTLDRIHLIYAISYHHILEQSGVRIKFICGFPFILFITPLCRDWSLTRFEIKSKHILSIGWYWADHRPLHITRSMSKWETFF